jgi:hypothetical protein
MREQIDPQFKVEKLLTIFPLIVRFSLDTYH